MLTVALDASTYRASVAVIEGGKLLVSEGVAMKGADAERLMPAVVDVLRRACADLASIGCVVCGSGPGSFTSLRIAAGIAKGLAVGRNCPLIAVPSLAFVVAGRSRTDGRYLAVLDALRGQVYAGLYVVKRDQVREVRPATLTGTVDIAVLAGAEAAAIVGPAHDGSSPIAAGVTRVRELIQSLGPVDVESWEPTYGRLAEAQVRWEATHGASLPPA